MGLLTKIQWCHHTWNPWRGCWKISPGCALCYAEKGSRRNPRVLGHWGKGTERSIAADAYWHLPYRWNNAARAAGERRRVFSLSLGDWLEDHPDLDGPRARMLVTIERTQSLDYLLLTKRPGEFGPALARSLEQPELRCADNARARRMVEEWLAGRPPENVWSGVSIEDQVRAEERYEPAISIPAVVRFFSCEPLLTSIWFPTLRGIDWVIIGGESGPDDKVRPCHVDWIKAILDQCRAHQVAPFVKQLGAWVEANDIIDAADYFPGSHDLSPGKSTPWGCARVHLSDPKGGDPEEWPKDIRIREFPR